MGRKPGLEWRTIRADLPPLLRCIKCGRFPTRHTIWSTSKPPRIARADLLCPVHGYLHPSEVK